MKDEKSAKIEDIRKDDSLKEKFDLDKFLKESVKAGEILREREREREHAEV